ncbi:MAG: LytTR family DNA-binding domain-containing protein [Undibacterium sp.]|nr:LytTR family DNA-binding domain-containing protein [Undibacterium sp.]
MNQSSKPTKHRVILVDDEDAGRITVAYALASHPDWQILGQFNNASDARDFLQNNVVDVVFLDIQMPKESGISLARSISLMSKPPLIIFVTAYNAHAVEAFEVHALDYLLKPFNPSRLASVLQSAHEMLEQRKAYATVLEMYVQSQAQKRDQIQQLVVRSVGEMECIQLKDVLWISSASNYVELHLARRTVLHRMTLAAIETLLDAQEFLRVHRTVIVRTDQMQKVQVVGDGVYSLHLLCGHEVPVSERYIEQVRAKFAN